MRYVSVRLLAVYYRQGGGFQAAARRRLLRVGHATDGHGQAHTTSHEVQVDRQIQLINPPSTSLRLPAWSFTSVSIASIISLLYDQQAACYVDGR